MIDYRDNSTVPMSQPTPPTRGDQLKLAWDAFTEADVALWACRQEIRNYEGALKELMCKREQIEKVWAERARTLTEIMTQEAPDFVMAGVKAAQLQQQNQQESAPSIPGNAIGLRRY